MIRVNGEPVEPTRQRLRVLTQAEAAHDMVAQVQRRHSEALKASKQRANALEWSLLVAGVVGSVLCLVTPNATTHAVLGLAAIVCSAVAVGSMIRGRL